MRRTTKRTRLLGGGVSLLAIMIGCVQTIWLRLKLIVKVLQSRASTPIRQHERSEA